MPAHTSPWQLDGFNARLALDQFAGQLELRNPASGMARRPALPRGWQFLVWICRRSIRLRQATKSIATFAAATWSPRTTKRTRVKRRGQVYWRIVKLATAPEQHAIELVASVQTSLLDSDPTVEIHSTLEADEAFSLPIQLQSAPHHSHFPNRCVATLSPPASYSASAALR